MPDYPSASAARPITMMTRRVPTFAEAPGGFKLLAQCPKGKNWKVETIWVRNRSVTMTFWLSLTMVPNGWIGTVGDDQLYIIGPNEPIPPGKFIVLNGTVGLGGGDRLYGFQLESTGTAVPPNDWGLNMVVAGSEFG